MRYRFQAAGQVYEILLERQDQTYQAVVNDETMAFELLDEQPGQLTLRLEGRPVTLYWAADGDQKWISLNGCTFLLEKPASRPAHGKAEAPGSQSVRAPMPAQVRAVQVQAGDPVEKGQTLLLLEAMKMEIRVKAPNAGQVKQVLVAQGQAVEKEQVLVEIGEGTSKAA